MTQQAGTTDVVERTVTVGASRQEAFRIFTEAFGTWWPRQYSIGAVDMADVVVEPKVGGRWYEVGVDGSECDVGRVLVHEPPDRIVIAWHLDGNWKYDPDPSHASEFEVRFISEDDSRTRVELEHRCFERHGAGAAAVRGGVDAPGGWDYCLAAYVAEVDAHR